MKFSEHSRRMHDWLARILEGQKTVIIFDDMAGWLEYQWLLFQNNEPRMHKSLCKTKKSRRVKK